RKLWKPHQRAFFPLGPDDPSLVLLRVKPERAEYWERSSGAVVNAIGMVRALLTDAPYRPGENEKLVLNG
ncbi:MAG: pyridoxamine 5'-phosphate oxidase family protein, partial [Nevskia sp.]|nr:pyridoxamine 5'-phosphate oxidase family protein [Nevskia sp.]